MRLLLMLVVVVVEVVEVVDVGGGGGVVVVEWFLSVVKEVVGLLSAVTCAVLSAAVEGATEQY